MNYELLKELKDAGYPLQYSSAKQALEKNWEEEWDASTDKGLIAPTLSELIEACGPEFVALVRWENDSWQASNCERDTPMVEHGLDIHGEGQNPEEAVARLWLALTKNN